jgi:ribonuclease H / adenosylcobalamin/alpha-ribazole phosphatase
MRLRPVIIEDFNEVQFGEWEGLTFEELAMRNEWRRFNLTRSTAAPPGGESMSEVQNRMSNQTESLSRKHEGQTVAVVSHCDPLRCLVVHWLGLSLDLMLRFELGPSSVTVGRTDSFQREILCLNWMEELPV